ncbi:cytochrome P450 [Nocardia terpenica]|uniref:cytochrome P450 n=1 Tax=Nocardia terpenica TaxID=455432 RepID=UPI001894C072|nr:cytochrome P450 [Nocardia terpenica]MBF6065724.1 cytochrome P450 [Nocardia terpenica]MBF6108238.1 cytochrome P450 [Nocardia terpenica]MBF6115839.1 cytochrome P450 [Nocardia terpenica]MBF6122969.1 cytochrome P450 [Nocardia terpenica]MBF6155958.1 cytochrome P450 [Nocardia terpenica]
MLTEEHAWRLPVVRDGAYDLPAVCRSMRQAGPIVPARTPNGKTVWVVTRHAEVRRVLADSRTTADRAHPNFPSFEQAADAPVLISGPNPFLVSMDPPAHTRARGDLKREFEERRIRDYAPVVEKIIAEAVGQLRAGPRPVDLVAEFALRVPSRVICELLGVPYADHDFFESRTPALIDNTVTPEQGRAAFGEIHEYLTGLVAAQEADPGDDIIGNYVRATRERGDYRREALVSHAFLLLIAGHETTANQIALSALALMQRPELREHLDGDPVRMASAVDEMLRYFTIVDTVSRVATADIEIGGVTIRAGDGIVALCTIANRDPDVYADPDELDLTRGSRRHLAFGFGPHQCLGQGLARLELELALRTLVTELPGMRLAVPATELEFKGTTSAFGVRRLPVTW